MHGIVIDYFWASAAGIYLLWVLYLAVMNLSRVHRLGTISRLAFVCGVPLLLLGLLVDVLVNCLVMTALFADLPKEALVTSRLQRYARGSGWRRRVALWFADHFLDDFDPSGKHV